jgi:hypothetical protein
MMGGIRGQYFDEIYMNTHRQVGTPLSQNPSTGKFLRIFKIVFFVVYFPCSGTMFGKAEKRGAQKD